MVYRWIHRSIGSKYRPGVATHRWYFSIWRVLETLLDTISDGVDTWCTYGTHVWYAQRGIQGCMVVHMVPQEMQEVMETIWGPQMGSQMGSISVNRVVSSYSRVVF